MQMDSNVKSIPIIDIAPLMEKCDDPKMAEDERVLEVVRLLDEACKDVGFFYVKGHGVPDSLVKEAREVTRKFFDLPDEEKHKIKLSSTTGYRGYQVIGGNLTSGNPDFHEAINSYKEVKPGEYGSLGGPLEGPNLWPDNPSNFKYVIDKYTWQMKELGRKLMRGVALALGGPVEAFEGDIAGNDFWMMRLIGYPGLSDSQRAEIKLTDIGCGAHTDDGLVTFINQTEDVQALQVKNRSDKWINATPIPGTFVCLLAEMVKTTFDKRIGTFDFCVQKTGGVAKCEVAVYGKLLADTLQGI